MCEEYTKVSEDVRVIHNELEKAYSWIFAAQEVLRPEKEEFDPDIKDLNNIETVLAFAIADLQEAITLCQIYRASKQGTVSDQQADNSDPVIENNLAIEKFRKSIMSDFPLEQAMREQEARAVLEDLEKKIERLRLLKLPGV